MASSGSPLKNRHFHQSLWHAWRGFSRAVAGERNLRFELLAAGAVIALGWWQHIDRRDWLWLVLAIGLVVAFELVNTAIEALVRLQVGTRFDPDPRVARVLDLAAGAVLVAAGAAAVIGIIIFWPYLFGRS